MNWYQYLYISENLPDDAQKIKKMVKKRIHTKPIYLIVLSDYTDGQLEIVSAITQQSPFFRKQTFHVIGVAKGYYHARNLVEKILMDVYSQTGHLDAKHYFSPFFEKGKGE